MSAHNHDEEIIKRFNSRPLKPAEAVKLSQKIEKKFSESVLAEIGEWGKKYELSFQFWPDQNNVYISKNGVELTCIGGRGSVDEILSDCCAYLRRINLKDK